ncbi:MAG: glycoside hydrolase family 57 protein [Rikenellaceae bacterium]
MKTICLHFQAHQPYKLKKYRFFNIGKDHLYADDNANDDNLKSVSNNCYSPLNSLLEELTKEYGKSFKASISISGLLAQQLKEKEKDTFDTFCRAAKGGSIEVVGETYAHSLACLGDNKEFERQVQKQQQMIKKDFKQTATTFCNTDLVFNNVIADMVSDLGFKTILTEGAEALLAWRSPNYVYNSTGKSTINILTRNHRLSDNITFGYHALGGGDTSISSRRFIDMIKNEEQGDVINLFLDYETFGGYISRENGIFDFLRAFVNEVCADSDLQFATPSEVVKSTKSCDTIGVTAAISCANARRNLSTWLENELQREAFSQLYSLGDDIRKSGNKSLIEAWEILQSSDHFCTISFKDEERHHGHNRDFSIQSPYDAFINYMNVIADLILQVKESKSKGVIKIKE